MNLKQFFSMILVVVAVANFILFLIGKMDLLYFWLIILVLYLFVKKVLPNLK